MTDASHRAGPAQKPSPSADLLAPEEMEAVLAASPAGICIIRNRVIHWANPTFYTLLGRPQGSLIRQNVRILYPTQQEYDRVGRQLDQGLEKKGQAVLDTRLSRKDGTAFDCRIRASCLDPGNPGRGRVVVLTDITEIKSLQTRVQQAQKMEAIGLLAGGVSHDFNNLLMGIQGHLSLMHINTESPDKLAVHIRQVGRLVQAAADLTGRLLGFARGGKYQIQALDINQVVSMALNLFQPTCKGITVETVLEKNPLPVNGDRSQLEQVCLNLLVNGAQAMVNTGNMRITTQNIHVGPDHGFHFKVSPGPYVEIAFQDSGIGMDEETQKKIFDPFFSTKGTGDSKGRGLGLSTVFGIVKNHGGFITVNSRRGKGATFTVCLPGADRITKDEENEAEPTGIHQIPGGSETILLVDDEEEILNVGKNFLEKLGYRSILARNGLEAVELFRSCQDEVDLVVLDLIMPQMSGQEAFLQLKEIRKDVRILISTGFTVDDKVEALLEKGCNGFIQKPFSMHKFSRVIRQILDTPAG